MVGAADGILTDVGTEVEDSSFCSVLLICAHLHAPIDAAIGECLAVGKIWLHVPRDAFVPTSHSRMAGEAMGL